MDSTRSGDAEVFLAHIDESGVGQRLIDHLEGVSRLSSNHAAKLGLGNAGALIGLLHDLGKYSAQFQDYLRRMSVEKDPNVRYVEKGTVDHSTAGAQSIWRALRVRGPAEEALGELLAVCVASHHSGLIDCVSPSGKDTLRTRMEKKDSETHEVEAWQKAEPELRRKVDELFDDPATIEPLREKLGQICRGETVEAIRRFKLGLLLRFLFSGLIDADRTDTADSAEPILAAERQGGGYKSWAELIGLAEAELGRLSSLGAMSEIRDRIAGYCLDAAASAKGIFTLTVPTGGGKTLSSLRFALHHAERWKLSRIIYVSPYTSIIDQNAAVVRRILERSDAPFGSVVLEHHGNLDPLVQTTRSKLLTENWDAPIVFTTSVQFLESLFGSGTRGVRRMHQLANSVVVFDEAQTLPVRCVHMFNNAVNFLVEQCGASVVLCTATQPLLHLVDATKGAIRLMAGAEMVPDVAGLFAAMVRTQVKDRRKAGGWDHSEVAGLAIAEMHSAGSCLVVVNTKREAYSIYRECLQMAGDGLVYHLSTAMCPAHRMDLLKKINENLALNRPLVCVSTQLIEAGVDISFGAAIRALAGLDSVAQTAGRCNRHGKRLVGNVYIVNLKGDLPRGLGEIRKAQEACQRVLDESLVGEEKVGNLLEDPKRMERFFHYYFNDRKFEMDYPVGPKQAERDDTLLSMLSENRLAWPVDRSPRTFFRQAFTSAANAFQVIDAGTRGVIVPYGSEGRDIIAALCSAFEPRRNFELLRRAQRYSISLFPHQLAILQNERAVYDAGDGTGILYLNEKYYGPEIGLNLAGAEEMEFTIA